MTALTPEDEERPFVKFARSVGWGDERIARAVACHKRGEAYSVVVTIGGEDGVTVEEVTGRAGVGTTEP